MLNFIKEYIDRLNKDDLIKLLERQNIELSDLELNVIYNHIKNNWYAFIYEDPKPILNDIENKLSKSNYDKLYNLYILAKEKYSFYL